MFYSFSLLVGLLYCLASVDCQTTDASNDGVLFPGTESRFDINAPFNPVDTPSDGITAEIFTAKQPFEFVMGPQEAVKPDTPPFNFTVGADASECMIQEEANEVFESNGGEIFFGCSVAPNPAVPEQFLITGNIPEVGRSADSYRFHVFNIDGEMMLQSNRFTVIEA